MSETLGQLAERVGAVLAAAGWRLVTAESCTGGGIAHRVTDVAGSSDWFDRGFVTYSNAAKQQMLGVPEQTLAEHGAVSAETVEAMARGALEHGEGDLAVAVSGVAGPGGGSTDKPVGLVWFAWATRDRAPTVRRVDFDGDRAAVRDGSIRVALEGVIELAEAAR